MAAVAVRYSELQEMETELLAISIDSVYTHKAWSDSELSKMVPGGCPFPMLADPESDRHPLRGLR